MLNKPVGNEGGGGRDVPFPTFWKMAFVILEYFPARKFLLPMPPDIISLLRSCQSTFHLLITISRSGASLATLVFSYHAMCIGRNWLR